MKVDYHSLVNSSVLFLNKGEDTKNKISNLMDQLASFGGDISSLRSNVGNMLLHLEGKSYPNNYSPFTG